MSRRLNIAFFGSSLVSAYWNGAATYYRGIIRALHEKGHKITFFEPDAYDRQQHRDISDPPWAQVIVYSALNEKFAYDALCMAKSCDLVIKASGVGVFDAFLESEMLSLHGGRRLVAFWDVDAPATLDRVRSDPADPFRRLIPRYDFIFTYGGGNPVVQEYLQLGAKECIPIYNALDASTHYPVSPDARFKCDLGFLGNRLPDREERVEEFFLKPAATLSGYRFLLGGNGWGEKSMPRNVKYIGHVYTADHNAFNSSSLAVLNINRESMARYGFSPPTRVFEAAGAGSCIITDAWEGVEMFLEPGKEVLLAGSGKEVAAHMASLTPERARSIGEAARKRILSGHTYAHRAELFEKALFNGTAV